jgi:hypothetical protein
MEIPQSRGMRIEVLRVRGTGKYVLLYNSGRRDKLTDVGKLIYTVNVDCVKFEYVVLAKYHHMLIFEFDLLTKQKILILCKKLL